MTDLGSAPAPARTCRECYVEKDIVFTSASGRRTTGRSPSPYHTNAWTAPKATPRRRRHRRASPGVGDCRQIKKVIVHGWDPLHGASREARDASPALKPSGHAAAR